MSRIRILAAVVFVAWVGVGLTACSKAPMSEGDVARTDPDVPDRIGEWGAGEIQVFDTESIYGYIDGHAEVYMAYGMRRCLSRRYEGPAGEPAIVLDLFELASDADAFGVFTHDRDGEVVEVGQAGLLRSGWLSFWKGNWYGSVYAEGESERTSEALLAIGSEAAASIHDVGVIPALVADLPPEGLEERSIRFFRTQEILNTVVYLGFDNVLRFGPEVSAVLGHYEIEEGSGWMLLVEYPDGETAGRAEGGALEAGMAVSRSDRRLTAVLAPQPATVADRLLDLSKGVAK